MKRMKSHTLSPFPHLLPSQSLPQRLVLSAQTLVLLLRLPQLRLQVLQVLLLLLPRLAGRLAVLNHPLLPFQHLHLHEEEEEVDEDWWENKEGEKENLEEKEGMKKLWEKEDNVLGNQWECSVEWNWEDDDKEKREMRQKSMNEEEQKGWTGEWCHLAPEGSKCTLALISQSLFKVSLETVGC